MQRDMKFIQKCSLNVMKADIREADGRENAIAKRSLKYLLTSHDTALRETPHWKNDTVIYVKSRVEVVPSFSNYCDINTHDSDLEKQT